MLVIAPMSLLLIVGCRNRARPANGDSDVPLAGEPDQYSATVLRTAEDGTGREIDISRETRSGEKRREEWTERGQNRALIWRPDIGKSFLLDLDQRVYVEIELATGHLDQSRAGASNPNNDSNPQRPGGPDSEDVTVQAIDHYFSDEQPPTRVETRVLPSVVIDGHACVVYEQRAFFTDGHSETARSFHAPDLSGLVLRVESQAEQGSARLITERRDIRTDVAPDTFVVPADFKKVDKLPR